MQLKQEWICCLQVETFDVKVIIKKAMNVAKCHRFVSNDMPVKSEMASLIFIASAYLGGYEYKVENKFTATEVCCKNLSSPSWKCIYRCASGEQFFRLRKIVFDCDGFWNDKIRVEILKSTGEFHDICQELRACNFDLSHFVCNDLVEHSQNVIVKWENSSIL